MLQSEIANIHGSLSWLPQVNWQAGLPFLIIIATMAIRGERSRHGARSATATSPRRPAPPRPRRGSSAGRPPRSSRLLTLDSTWRGAIIVSTTTAVIALSVVVLTGYVGQISLMPHGARRHQRVRHGQAHRRWHIPFPIAPLLAGAARGRLRVARRPAGGAGAGHQPRHRHARRRDRHRGARAQVELVHRRRAGQHRAAAPTLFGLDLGIGAAGRPTTGRRSASSASSCWRSMAVSVANLRRGADRPALARRPGQRAGRVVGSASTSAAPSSSRSRVSIFIAGLGGALLRLRHPNLSVSSFTVFASLALIALVYLGGIASIAGALVAGILAEGGIASAGQTGSQTQFAISGLALIAVAVLYPNGISGGLYALRDRVARRARPRPGRGLPTHGRPLEHDRGPCRRGDPRAVDRSTAPLG